MLRQLLHECSLKHIGIKPLSVYKEHGSHLKLYNGRGMHLPLPLALEQEDLGSSPYCKGLLIYVPGLIQFSSVQLLSHVWLFAALWTAARQASLSITNFWSSLKLMSIESVMPSNNLIHCRPLLLPPSIFPSIRVFFKESVLCIRWPKDWSFSFSISPSNEYSGLISLALTGLILQSKGLSRVFSNTTVQQQPFFCTQLSL